MYLFLSWLTAQVAVPLPVAQRAVEKPVWRSATAVIESTHDVVPGVAESMPGAPSFEIPFHPRAPRLAPGPSGATATSIPLGGLSGTGRADATASFGFAGLGQTPWRPPDPTIAVGPDHIVETVNMQIAFYTKEGVLQFTQNLDSSGTPGFFESVGGGPLCFDPKCLYDPHSGRFVVVALERYAETEEGYIDIAVSDDSDPNGIWFKYHTDDVTNVGGINFWVDYPGLGVDESAIYVTGDLYDFSDSFTAGVKYRIFDKAPLLAGAPASYADLLDGSSQSVQGALSFDGGTQPFFVSVGGVDSIRLQCIESPLGSPNLVTQDVPVPTFFPPGQDVPNLAGCGISALDGRILSAALRNNRIVAAHAIRSGTKVVARWYEFLLGDWPSIGLPGLTQNGNIDAGGTVHTWFPAIMTNACGETGVVMARSSSTEFAGIAYTGRRRLDPDSQMTIPLTTLATGTSGYCDFRWGDYFGIAVDPNDGHTFWGVGEYAVGLSTWQTWISRFSFNRAPEFAPQVPCGATIEVDAGGTALFIVAGFDWDSCDSVTLSATGTPDGAVHTPSLPLTDDVPVTSFEWIPRHSQSGTHVVTYTITDGELSANCEITIIVRSKVRPHPGP